MSLEVEVVGRDSSKQSPYARLRFLVVEDQGFQRWMVEKLLRSLGATHIQLANDGMAALQAIAADPTPIDIVVSDLDMPGMDGMELIRHLGEAHSNASLIVSSSLDRALIASVETMAHAYGVHLLGAVDKPATAQRLAEVIALHVARREDKRPPPEPFTLDEVREGLMRGQIEPWFQPKVDMDSGRVIGAEALARWHHPFRGIVSPQQFIPLLEGGDSIDRLTDIMLARSAAMCRDWHAAGVQASVSVNLSLRSMADVKLADRLSELVRTQGLEPRHVLLEITESAEAAHLGRALENLARLRMRGFGLSIDDYGTGYSSPEQLARIPFTELKIDRGFVRMAATRLADRALLESSLELAERLGMQAIAEGVETQAEWNLLRQCGCPAAQGFFVAAPMPSTEILDWLQAR